jgi:hypothetical protein
MGATYSALEAGILKIAIFELDLQKAVYSWSATTSMVGRDISCRHWKSIPQSKLQLHRRVKHLFAPRLKPAYR